MERLLQEMRNWINAGDRKVVIGISGHGAAGKSTFTNELTNFLGRDEVNVMNTDPYIVSSAVRKYTIIPYTYKGEDHEYKMTACHPAAHDVPALERDIRMNKSGLDFYTIGNAYTSSELISADKRVTVVEGMTVAFSNPELFDLKIYFYTTGETEFLRRSGRDITERGMELAYLHRSHEDRRIQYDVFMHPYSRHFDVIIQNSDEGNRIEKNTFGFQLGGSDFL